MHVLDPDSKYIAVVTHRARLRLRRVCFDEGIDDDVLALHTPAFSRLSLQNVGRTHPWKTEKVRVTVRTALRAINFIEVLKQELEFPSQ